MTAIVFPDIPIGNLTLIEMVSAMAHDVGLIAPDAVIGSTSRNWQEAEKFANALGRDLQRRVDWGGLVRTATLAGTGADAAISLPTNFARFATGVTMTYSGAPVRPLTRSEWGSLTPSEGSPRYFLLEDESVRLWPYLAASDTVGITYISEEWCDSGYAFAADDDTVIFPSDLFIKGLIVQWRRQKGMDYADHEADFEAALLQYAGFDDRGRF